jgi:hypothetical protein
VASERQSPGAILASSQLSGTVADIDDDPDAPEGAWLEQSSNNTDTSVRVSFPTPTGAPTSGSGLQEFRALVRKTTGQSGVPTARIELWENGALVAAGSETNVTSESGQVVSFTWNASQLSGTDGSGVECLVYGTKTGGSPPTRAAVDVGAIEWNVEYSAGSTQSLSGSAAATSSASGAARRTRGVSVAVAALALAAGALSATRPIAGSAAATSDATATLSVSGSTSIAGTAAATAGATGALSATRSISGTAAATGAPSGAVSVSGSTSLAGTVAATGTAAGAAVVTRGLGGGAVATSDATGSLSVSGSALLAGSAAATATAGGALSATRSIAGTATATGTASGAVSLSGSASLAGTTAAATSTSGAVSVARPLVGMLSASTASAGALSSTRSISGTVVATAAASGVITNPPKLLAGASATTTAATGAATVTRSLAGTAAATVAATGAVSVDAALAGTVAASSGASARIRTTNATIPITGSHVEIEPRGLRTALFARSLDVEVIVYRWKIGENLAPLRLALKNTDGSPLDLSAADAVELRVRQPNGAVVTWEAVITDDEAGEVEYAILATDLDAGGPGIWRFEAKVGGGRCDILPSHGVSRFWVGAVLE